MAAKVPATFSEKETNNSSGLKTQLNGVGTRTGVLASNSVSILNAVQFAFSGGFLGVKERQGREREAVSRAILDAARDLFVAEGYHNVSIRKIAERIEYSPAAIYSYFPSKDDIFFALAEEGFRILFTPPERKADDADGDLLKPIRGAFWRVYEFSKSHPEYFALMFLDRTVPQISQNWERFEFVRDLKAQLGAGIQRAIDAGLFPAGHQRARRLPHSRRRDHRRGGRAPVWTSGTGRRLGCARPRHARGGVDRPTHRLPHDLCSHALP